MAEADPGGFPTGDGPVDLTPEQQSCLIELVENSDLPATPKGFIIPALERGSIQDPSRMAGLKERAGIDLDSASPIPAGCRLRGRLNHGTDRHRPERPEVIRDTDVEKGFIAALPVMARRPTS